ncbi:aminoglycoside phosphotransferase (APT) family kinase protein [Rhodococcus sp. OK519]|uniref:phosphotransferase family protein n=1 Tax=Rhodococcus sp. OK519 TaxID=2135729 RepID=UPI000D39DB50|nr:aminoglycoside phosphotransferase (APT) family kinase protein [Rhodococcus sp. OK519]
MGLSAEQRRSLDRWLDENELHCGATTDVTPVRGGRSHVMFRLRRADATWILRSPAAVAIDAAAAGLRREFRVLGALGGTRVPHPAPVALCDDPAVLGTEFYLMEDVDGISPMPRHLAQLHAAPEPTAVVDALIDALAHLHDVDWRRVGLDDFGRPDGFHERQTARWTGQLRSYGENGLDGLEDVIAWLDGHLPTSWQPTLMHGDYHMMNVLIAVDDPVRVSAVLDWETTTIGDPLLDLAGFLEVCREVYRPEDGWPTQQYMAARYASRRGIGDAVDLTYYRVLYNYRLAVLLEGIHQRSRLDPTRPTDDAMGQRARSTARRAKELIE